MTHRSLRFLLSALLVPAFASVAAAQPVATAGPAAGSTMINFDELSAGSLITAQYAALGMTVGGEACATNSYDGIFGNESSPIQVTNFSCSGTLTAVTFLFSTPITSFGFDGLSNNNIFLSTAGGTLSYVARASTDLTWIGLYDANGFTSVTASADVNGAFVFDDLAFSAAVVTPEPASLALLATGMVAIGGMAARRRKTA